MSFSTPFAQESLDVGELLLHLGVNVTVDSLSLPLHLLLNASKLIGKFCGDLRLFGVLIIHHFL